MTWFGPNESPAQVWAVEETSVQLTWGRLPAGPVTATVGGVQTSIDHRGGPGSMDVHGLDPDSEVSIGLRWDGGETTLVTKTLERSLGEELFRFATISDLHLGARRWGAFNTITDPSDHPVPHPYRCASAAIGEARDWGAELLIIKGDATQHECAADFAELGRLVDQFPDLAMLLIPGNHDVDGRDGTIPLTVGDRGLAFTRKVDTLDVPGARVIVADTTMPGHGRGSLDRTATALLDRAATSDRPVFLALHHQLQATRLPRHWPVGISAPQSTRFLDKLDRLRQPAMVSSGHTHRNRSRVHGDVLLTEVASTKDWPGVWAGYAVHEGGIRQVVKRIKDPDAIAWTEFSRRAVGGLWAMWSPGLIEQRCVSNRWAKRPSLIG